MPPADGDWADSLASTAGRQNGFSEAFIAKAAPLASMSGGLSLQQVRIAAFLGFSNSVCMW